MFLFIFSFTNLDFCFSVLFLQIYRILGCFHQIPLLLSFVCSFYLFGADAVLGCFSFLRFSFFGQQIRLLQSNSKFQHLLQPQPIPEDFLIRLCLFLCLKSIQIFKLHCHFSNLNCWDCQQHHWGGSCTASYHPQCTCGCVCRVSQEVLMMDLVPLKAKIFCPGR